MEKYQTTISSDVEKVPYDVVEETSSPASSQPPRPNSRASINEKKLIWKIDLSILPILFAAYFLQFLDKVIYNVSLPDC